MQRPALGDELLGGQVRGDFSTPGDGEGLVAWAGPDWTGRVRWGEGRVMSNDGVSDADDRSTE